MNNFPALETETLARWATEDTFKACLTMSEGAEPYHLYDGPPFANGLPHYGHLLTGFVKDAVPRYKTMRGYHVDRVFGWDTHGLPAELEAMGQLDLKTTADVEALGLEAFSEACRRSVLKYAEQWEDQVTRQARWVDFEGGYKTMDLTFMESAMWAFKELHQKGLVYEGFRVLPYCWQDQTPLSAHELSMDGDGYREVSGTAVTLGLKLSSPDELLDGARALLWTTTPWTLPANLLLAVNRGGTYAVVRHGNSGLKLLLGEAALDRYDEKLGPVELLGTVRGSDLLGLSYEPPFSYYEGLHPLAHTVQEADWVEMDGAGTGLVHVAPGFGEVDKALCDSLGVPTVVPMDDGGRYTEPVVDYVGQRVLDANDRVAQDLKDRAPAVASSSYLLEASQYSHSYPHCWRCGQPLVYRGVDSWFVAASKLKTRMLELADGVQWVPENSGNQFKAWLSQVRDWGVSRNRYWGSPVPVWKSDDPAYPRSDFYGSLEELEGDFGRLPRNGEGEVDLHRPYVDELTRPNPDDPSGRSTMRRVPEVLDVWFDSGAMPFAQQHYPFENVERFNSTFPADFVVEYVAQCRGWFYTLHVLSTALFDRPAFKTCLSHGVVLGSDGRKMSKKLKNYPPVEGVFEQYGADAMRWYLMSSPVLKGGNLVVTDEGLRNTVRDVLNPLLNSHRWLELQWERWGKEPNFTALSDPLDRALSSVFSSYLAAMGEAMDAYDFAAACKLSQEFVEYLNNWWLRSSRPRFSGTSLTASGREALALLARVLQDLDRSLAPLLPLTAEHLWTLAGGEGSVHHESYPEPDTYETHPEDEAAMALVQEVASRASALRKAHGLRQRQPLASATVESDPQTTTHLAKHRDLLLEQLNVKVLCYGEASEEAEKTLELLPRVAGPRLGSSMKLVLAAVKAGEWALGPDGLPTAAGVRLQPGEYVWKDSPNLDPSKLSWSKGTLSLDLHPDEALLREGEVADLLRLLKDARKAAGLPAGEKATVRLQAPHSSHARLATHLPALTSATGSEVLLAEGDTVCFTVQAPT